MRSEEEQRNANTVRAYLAAGDAFDPDAVGQQLAPDVVQTNLPNVLSPRLSKRGRDEILTEAREAGYFLRSRRVEVERLLARDSEVAVEGVWVGILKVEIGPLKEGDELRAYVALFFTLCDGKITAETAHYIFDLPTS
jgi:ketosteroid isomerase-like protein